VRVCEERARWGLLREKKRGSSVESRRKVGVDAKARERQQQELLGDA
jgi:hypothetical protein